MTLASEWVREIVCYVAVGDMCWRVRRVNSAQLSAQGYDHLEGSEAYKAVQADIARERREYLATLNQSDPTAKAEAVAQVAVAERSRTLRRLEALESTPEGKRALLARCDAYLCASVDAAGRLAQRVTEPQIFDAAPAILGEWEPWQWVAATENDAPDAGKVSVGLLGEVDRELIGLAIQSTQGGLTRRRVTTFRPGPGAPSAPAPAGGGLPHGPRDGGAVGTGADGAGDRVPGAPGE
jgi:hypothetical protein